MLLRKSSYALIMLTEFQPWCAYSELPWVCEWSMSCMNHYECNMLKPSSTMTSFPTNVQRPSQVPGASWPRTSWREEWWSQKEMPACLGAHAMPCAMCHTLDMHEWMHLGLWIIACLTLKWLCGNLDGKSKLVGRACLSCHSFDSDSNCIFGQGGLWFLTWHACLHWFGFRIQPSCVQSKVCFWYLSHGFVPWTAGWLHSEAHYSSVSKGHVLFHVHAWEESRSTPCQFHACTCIIYYPCIAWAVRYSSCWSCWWTCWNFQM